MELSFDGDEMNLHMPQDPESEAELKNLAAVPYQIISPANNKAIIGIYQDSMLGCYQFTRENVKFGPREAMNLLMMFDGVNTTELFKNPERPISCFDILNNSVVFTPSNIISKFIASRGPNLTFSLVN